MVFFRFIWYEEFLKRCDHRCTNNLCTLNEQIMYCSSFTWLVILHECMSHKFDVITPKTDITNRISEQNSKYSCHERETHRLTNGCFGKSRLYQNNQSTTLHRIHLSIRTFLTSTTISWQI